MPTTAIRRALIAVYDKTGITEFARALVDEFGIEIISTGGTAKHLKDAGIPVTMVETVTGFPEMLDGRVKTLHPRIHAGILADRDNPEHMRQLAEHGIQPIDMVVVNLYPFEKTIADPNCKFEDAIEMIDIGGPCLLRAAAKNHRHVWILSDFFFYSQFVDVLNNRHRFSPAQFRSFVARHIFAHISAYDRRVWAYLDGLVQDGSPQSQDAACPESFGFYLFREKQFRYGENPHQLGAYCRGWSDTTPDEPPSAITLEKQQFSFNNYVDADAALGLCAELTRAELGKLWNRPMAGPGDRENPNRPAQPAGFPSINQQKFTRRNLPHLQRPGATYFVTFRVMSGTLSEAERDIAMECCLFPDGKKYCLHAAVVMPDHVHLMISPLPNHTDQYYSLSEILHSVKGVSGLKISQLRGGNQKIWQDESFDRIMRDAKEYEDTLLYMFNNPATAGLEDNAPYSWHLMEENWGWVKEDSAAGVDLHHVLKAKAGCAARNWQETQNSKTDRPLAGSTKLQDNRPLAGATNQKDTSTHVAVFIKHTNACGVGISSDPIGAYRAAYMGDPNAAMGGVLAVNFRVETEFATTVMETYDRFGKAAGAGGFFVEVWVAPSFSDDAVDLIRAKKKWGANVRLLSVGDMSVEPDPKALEYKTIAGGMLAQTPDLLGLNEDQWKVVTKRQPTESEMSDLRLAWLIAKHTKSNAISICKDGMLIGNGAGQMSRVMSCRIATWLAKENGHAEKLAGSVAASDAFFPFRDGPGILIDAGITALIQPGGSKRDEETIALCDERGVAMIFTGTRHFKH